MESAVRDRRIDFVLLNGGMYVMLAQRYALSAPLATRVIVDKGKPMVAFGGVILARAERNDIVALGDLRGKRIAATSTSSFGGYQTQAYELLQAGLHLPGDVTLVKTEMPLNGMLFATEAQTLSGKSRAQLAELMMYRR